MERLFESSHQSGSDQNQPTTATMEEISDSAKSTKDKYKIVDINDKEQMRSLNAGEIVRGQNGKLYRARKTIYPSIAGGPHGYGDPDDKNLRKIEKDIVITDLMAKRVDGVECRADFQAFIQCLNAEGEFSGPSKCKPYQLKYEDCKLAKFQDDDFREKVTEDYLKERSELRRTGLNMKQRKFMEYLQWKEKTRPIVQDTVSDQLKS